MNFLTRRLANLVKASVIRRKWVPMTNGAANCSTTANEHDHFLPADFCESVPGIDMTSWVVPIVPNLRFFALVKPFWFGTLLMTAPMDKA